MVKACTTDAIYFLTAMVCFRSAVSDLQEGLHDAITGAPLSDVAQLTTLCEEVEIADAVYKSDARAMCKASKIRPAKAGHLCSALFAWLTLHGCLA